MIDGNKKVVPLERQDQVNQSNRKLDSDQMILFEYRFIRFQYVNG
jgi:hypothetical protein